MKLSENGDDEPPGSWLGGEEADLSMTIGKDGPSLGSRIKEYWNSKYCVQRFFISHVALYNCCKHLAVMSNEKKRCHNSCLSKFVNISASSGEGSSCGELRVTHRRLDRTRTSPAQMPANWPASIRVLWVLFKYSDHI